MTESDKNLMLSRILKKSPYGFTKAGFKLEQDFANSSVLLRYKHNQITKTEETGVIAQPTDVPDSAISERKKMKNPYHSFGQNLKPFVEDPPKNGEDRDSSKQSFVNLTDFASPAEEKVSDSLTDKNTSKVVFNDRKKLGLNLFRNPKINKANHNLQPM